MYAPLNQDTHVDPLVVECLFESPLELLVERACRRFTELKLDPDRHARLIAHRMKAGSQRN